MRVNNSIRSEINFYFNYLINNLTSLDEEIFSVLLSVTLLWDLVVGIELVVAIKEGEVKSFCIVVGKCQIVKSRIKNDTKRNLSNKKFNKKVLKSFKSDSRCKTSLSSVVLTNKKVLYSRC